MTGKRYYLTTLGAWQRHAHRFANSHWIALHSPSAKDPRSDDGVSLVIGARHAVRAPASDDGDVSQRDPDSTTFIAVLVEGDEGAHLVLEDDAAFEPLPHPFAPQPISTAAQAALAAHGVAPDATTFEAAEALARLHPLLKPRVF